MGTGYRPGNNRPDLKIKSGTFQTKDAVPMWVQHRRFAALGPLSLKQFTAAVHPTDLNALTSLIQEVKTSAHPEIPVHTFGDCPWRGHGQPRQTRPGTGGILPGDKSQKSRPMGSGFLYILPGPFVLTKKQSTRGR